MTVSQSIEGLEILHLSCCGRLANGPQVWRALRLHISSALAGAAATPDSVVMYAHYEI